MMRFDRFLMYFFTVLFFATELYHFVISFIQLMLQHTFMKISGSTPKVVDKYLL